MCSCASPRNAAAHVRFGSKADICSAKSYVRFAPKSGHCVVFEECPLWAISGANEDAGHACL